jgi:antitoxin component YwqK of YwqJK toxin-antitoxin module
MRAIIYVFILFPFILVGQGLKRYIKDNRINGTGTVVEYGGGLMDYGCRPIDSQDTNEIISITEYRNNKMDGRCIYFFNYPNDTATVESYENGLLNGIFYEKYKNGKLREKILYKEGVIVGKKEGWTEDGAKILDSIIYNEAGNRFYTKGKLCNGRRAVYDNNGSYAIANVYFNMGEIDSINSYAKASCDRIFEMKRNYHDSTRTFTLYDEHGNITSTSSYKIILIYPNKFSSWNGQISFTDQDKLIQDGKFIEYYNDSSHTIKSITFYKNDLKVGQWNFYNEKGTLDSTEMYDQNKLIKTRRNKKY